MRVEFKDYYETLGVPRDADGKAIKRAFHKLARRYHPDHNPDDAEAEARFKAITEAYEVLSDPEKRAKYDRFGQAWNRHSQAGGPGGFDWSGWAPGPGQGQTRRYTAEDLESIFGASGGGGFSDFFETLFGRGAGAPRRAPTMGQAGRDLEQAVEISFDESFHGARRILNKDGRRLEVSIPPGVRTGSRVRMRGEGMPGQGGGAAGDLYLLVEVTPDPRYERREDDLHVQVPVPVATAALGGEVRVPTPDGEVQLKLPPGTQNGRRFRLRGRGMPRLKAPDSRGDLYAVVELRLPEPLTEAERALFEELRKLRPEG